MLGLKKKKKQMEEITEKETASDGKIKFSYSFSKKRKNK